MLVMRFLEGIPLTEARERVSSLSRFKREMFKKRVLTRVSEAYGRMILLEGLFQVCVWKRGGGGRREG